MSRRTWVSLVINNLILAPLIVSTGLGQPVDRRVVGYYSSWSVYDRDYHVTDIAADKVDVINYAFATIIDGEIALNDPYADVEQLYTGDRRDPGSLRGSFRRLQVLKENHPHLKTLITVRDREGSGGDFSDLALTAESRARFATSCAGFIERYGFDGVDIDWEFPGGTPENASRSEDRSNFTRLLEELRSELDRSGSHLLTIAAGASPFMIENLELEAIAAVVDWINVMTYDFHGPRANGSASVTNFNSPLRPVPASPLTEPYVSVYNVEATMEAYVARGVPREKLNVGLACFGRGYGDVINENDGLYAGYGGPAAVGTWVEGVFDYWDLARNYVGSGGYVRHWSDEAKVPWLYDPTERIMISYDDRQSISEKCRFVQEADLGGAMLWDLGADRDGELLSVCHEILNGRIAPLVAERARVLCWNSPNPFNPQTTIAFELIDARPVRGEVVDVQGRLIRVLIDEHKESGSHHVVWDGRDTGGSLAPSGVYFYRLQVGGRTTARKMVLTRSAAGQGL